MRTQFLISLITLIFLIVVPGHTQERFVYKQIDSIELFMEYYSPPKVDSADLRPAMIFFYGGAWKRANFYQFEQHAKYFSERGIACFLADYRVKDKHNSSPFEALKDAKSAIRYVRKYAEDFGIDPTKLIAAGGSAGGHLAAATALILHHTAATDDLNISCIPNALVLFNPVIDNGPGGFGYDRVGDSFPMFSPLHNIRRGAPPTLIHLGTNDPLIPVETAAYYKMVMEKVDSKCELELYEGKKHGFFNYKYFDVYKETVQKTDRFLQSLGYLNELPLVTIK